jgi:hypothetical protein
MSSINDYRLRLEQQMATERAFSEIARWGSALESLGAQNVLGPARGDSSDLDRLQEAITGPKANPDPTFRAEALGEFVSRSELSSAQQLPLERLSDPQETPQVRLVALSLLKSLAISSPTFSEWRPAYLQALRSAINEPDLRLPAFDTLIAQGDRFAQERLVQGLKDPNQALIEPADALDLLGEDPHADVREQARKIVDQPPDERTLQAAIRHLASDPQSVDRLRDLISNPQRTVTARKMAATALNVLDPDALPVPEEIRLDARGIDAADAEVAEDSVVEFVRILASRRRR